MSEETISNVVVSPNPVNETANFTFNTNGANEVAITIVDLAGKIVATSVVSNVNSVDVNTAELNAGSYIYTIQAGESTVTGKLIKK
jgi:hypothetical protein